MIRHYMNLLENAAQLPEDNRPELTSGWRYPDPEKTWMVARSYTPRRDLTIGQVTKERPNRIMAKVVHVIRSNAAGSEVQSEWDWNGKETMFPPTQVMGRFATVEEAEAAVERGLKAWDNATVAVQEASKAMLKAQSVRWKEMAAAIQGPR